MPVDAIRMVRKMRGGAQAHLIEASDGKYYVVKFQNNPQHRRILVNEMVASVLLRFLQILEPDFAIVRLSREFLAQNPDVHIQLGSHRVEVVPGWHYGSCHPGDPARMAVYDFLPDALLSRVANLDHFRGVLAFDKWVGNADARQAVFFRARLREWTPAPGQHPLQKGFVALMLDHGYIFDGPNWDFADSPLQGMYFRPLVYEGVRGLDDFQPWLDQIAHFPVEVIDQAARQVPPEWLEGDQENFERLLDRLVRRRRRVADLVADCRKGRTNPFAHWA